jgi:hypothetical protein
MADVATHDVNEVVLAAELTFAAASSYIGLSNGRQGYARNHDLSASLFGFAVGITSLALSTSNNAQVPALDVGTGIVAVVGSVLRFPRSGSKHEVSKDGPHDENSASLKLVPGLWQIKMRVTF